MKVGVSLPGESGFLCSVVGQEPENAVEAWLQSTSKGSGPPAVVPPGNGRNSMKVECAELGREALRLSSTAVVSAWLGGYLNSTALIVDKSHITCAVESL